MAETAAVVEGFTQSTNAPAATGIQVAVLQDTAGYDQQIVTIGDGSTSNTGGIVAPGTANSTGNAQLVAATSQSVTFSASSISSGTAYDVGNYRWVAVQITSQYAGTTPTIAFQTSLDGINWYGTELVSSASASNTGGSTTTATGIWHGPITGRYFRLNFTGAYTSGTASGLIVFSSLATAMHTMGVLAAGGQSDSASGLATATNTVRTIAEKYSFNGTTWDQDRNNATGAVLAAGQTASVASTILTTYNARALAIVINISAITTGTLTVTVNGETSSGYFHPLIASTALATTGVTTLYVFPGAPVTANASANIPVPRTVQVVTAITGTVTYGIDYELAC